MRYTENTKHKPDLDDIVVIEAPQQAEFTQCAFGQSSRLEDLLALLDGVHGVVLGSILRGTDDTCRNRTKEKELTCDY